MFNKVILVGNLTRDVETLNTANSVIGSTGLATTRKWKGRNGEQKEEVCFIDLTLFARTAEIAKQYTRKGSKVLIEGRLALQQWTTADGDKRSRHAIIVESIKMLDSRATKQSNNTNQGDNQDDEFPF